jgi:CelD/BcsL family acetyltransferase involved in cellulose biosynthesis
MIPERLMTLKIDTYDSADAFETLRDEWKDLHANGQQCPIFTTWEWQSNWWAAYHPGELWIITLRNEDGLLVGLAPWFIQSLESGRWVRSIGCVDVTDYLELPIRKGYETAVLEELTAYVLQEKARYDRLDFCNIPHEAPILALWPPMLQEAGFKVQVSQQEVCPVIDLPEDFPTYLNQLDKKDRHELRRKLRLGRGAGEDITWSYEDHTAIERFLALMRASAPEKAKFLDDPQNVDFFRRVVPAVAECGWLRMSFIQFNGKDAAAYLSFDYGNEILLYNSGLDPTVRGDLGLGIILLAYLIEDAIQMRRDAFNFLRGNEVYKYRFGGVDSPVMMLTAHVA